jgi:hypothetical protein
MGALKWTDLSGSGRISRAYAKHRRSKSDPGIAKSQKKLLTPNVEEIVNRVGSAYGISASQVLDRHYVEAYWLAAYSMRRVGNLRWWEMSLDAWEFPLHGSHRFKRKLRMERRVRRWMQS